MKRYDLVAGHDSASRNPDKGGGASANSPPSLWNRLAWRLPLALLGWWILSEGQTDALPLGAAAVTAAVAASLALTPGSPYTPRPAGLLLFFGWFLGRSCVAGLQVAARILRPRLTIDPYIARVPLSLPPGAPRLLLADTLSLLPGTLSVSLEDDDLLLHSLGGKGDLHGDVRRAERRVAQLLGLPGGLA